MLLYSLLFKYSQVVANISKYSAANFTCFTPQWLCLPLKKWAQQLIDSIHENLMTADTDQAIVICSSLAKIELNDHYPLGLTLTNFEL